VFVSFALKNNAANALSNHWKDQEPIFTAFYDVVGVVVNARAAEEVGVDV
jgi:hypothetical protein